MGGFISIISVTDGLLVKYLKSAQITCQMIYHNNFIILLVKNYDKLTMLFLCQKYFQNEFPYVALTVTTCIVNWVPGFITQFQVSWPLGGKLGL